MQAPHLAQKPPKPHVILSYMIFESSMVLKQTGENTFTLTFKYQAETELVVSLFTFVEESFNVDTSTTEGLVADKKKGSEHHLVLPPSPQPKETKIEGINIKMDEKYYFAETILNNYYPLMIRFVSSTDPGKSAVDQSSATC